MTKGLPRGGYGSSGFNSNDSRREEGHGLIEVAKAQDADASADTEKAVEADKEESEPADEGAGNEPKDEAEAKPQVVRREFVRFNSESVPAPASSEEGHENDDAGAAQGRRGGGRHHANVPHFGDEVRFRIATHRKSGMKRAVDLTVTCSARKKLEQEMEEKLATMERELGVVDRIKAGGGFIRCCDRPDDVYFPFHEVRESAAAEGEQAADANAAEADGAKPSSPRRSSGNRPSKSPLREGDEVSFYVYEERDDESGRSRPRLTAFRVQKVPQGTVSFEDVVRSDVEGKVKKAPREPRNGPEIMGSITFAGPVVAPPEEAADEENDGAHEETGAESAEAPASTKKGNGKKGKAKKKLAKIPVLPFRLSDTADVSYIPLAGDSVLFDEVLEKRSGKLKAANIRIVALNPKNRETGVITVMKEEFGFIKCAERACDAYFRFSDVMSTRNDFRSGTEVSFDVSTDSSKSDNARASRIQILPHGSVKWESVVATDLSGEVTSLPSKRSNNARGNLGQKSFYKVHNGKIRFATPEGKQFLIDFLPELKQQVDEAFIAKEGSESNAEEDVRLEFSVSLSKFERAVIHQYCEWLGVGHESSGDKQSRSLALVSKGKVSVELLAEKHADIPDLEVEFALDDVADVRYNPRLGDEVKFQLVLVNRTKQFMGQSVVCTKAAPAPQKKAKESAAATDAMGEGFIVAIKSEGFGFIRPANKGQGVEENLFFHVNEILTGQRQEDLKEGMEVQYTVNYDDKKKKSRAVAVSVVPEGTVKEVEAQVLRGVVTRASFLHRMKGAPRFTKTPNNKVTSSIGKIRIASHDSTDELKDEEDDDENGDEGEHEAEEDAQDDTTGAEGEEKSAEVADKDSHDEEKPGSAKASAKPKKKSDTHSYIYHIQDIVDPAVILREGDEIEFVALATPKGLRATRIRLIAGHSKQGVVVKVLEDLGGIIRVDGDEPVDVHFTARTVLRGDILKEGDRVEFAFKAAPAKAKSGENDETEEGEANVAGNATSVLRIGSSGVEQSSSRRTARTVNSTLLQAMRQVGANAIVASRMAKGPDGTRGFKDGWRSGAGKAVESDEVTEDAASSPDQETSA